MRSDLPGLEWLPRSMHMRRNMGPTLNGPELAKGIEGQSNRSCQMESFTASAAAKVPLYCLKWGPTSAVAWTEVRGSYRVRVEYTSKS